MNASEKKKLRALVERLEARTVTRWRGDSWGGFDETYPDGDCVKAAAAIRMLIAEIEKGNTRASSPEN